MPNPFSPVLSGMLAFLLFAIGNAFIGYGVDKSREIGGWAVWIVAPALPLFFAASYFLLSGVFGWDLL